MAKPEGRRLIIEGIQTLLGTPATRAGFIDLARLRYERNTADPEALDSLSR
jgi:hypothetical protein